jgi:thiol-disulfide isomerase/thioredoxin/outer membrane lipoprotein-sorting protein
MKHLSRYFLCALLLIITSQASPSQIPAKPIEKPLNRPGEDADFQRYLNSGRISVVAFYADWCPSCRSWLPVLDAVNTHFPDMQVLFMDIGEWDTPVTEKYGVESVPHFKIYDQSARPIVEGPAAKDWLRQAIAKRLEARARGTRLSGQPDRLNVNAAARSVTTKPRSNSRTARAPALEVVSRREKIDSSGPLPPVDQVINRYIEALGGQDAALRFTTRSAKGKINISTIGRGSFATHAKAPNKMVMTVDIPEVGVVTQGFNGTQGWSQSTRTGMRPAKGVELSALKRDADFLGFLRLKANYPQMRLLGTSKIGFREVYVIEARPPAGEAEKFYFSKENGLIIRWDAVRAAFGMRTSAEIYLDDWTDVDGLKMPLTITQMFPGASVVLTFDEVKHGVQINDTVFNTPVTK